MAQVELDLTADDEGLSTAEQKYDPTPIINELRGYVNAWRALPNPSQWQVTPEPGHLGRKCEPDESDLHRRRVMRQEITDMSCKRIRAVVTSRISTARSRSNAVRVVLDLYNPSDGIRHVYFTTANLTLWQANCPPPKSHVNWIVFDSEWEAESCRMAELHPRLRSHVKDHSLGLGVPYRLCGSQRHHWLDFNLRINDKEDDDGHKTR